MGQRYAKGEHALGECARSGRKMLLKDMVSDGYYPNLLVDPAWREDKHPQEYLPKVEDPVALYRPSPSREAGPTSPTLSGDIEASTTGALTWTESVTYVNQIAEYQVWRSADVLSSESGYADSFSLLATVTVDRDYKGLITNDPLSYDNEGLDFAGHFYSYFVRAIPVRVGEASVPQTAPADSNVVALTEPPSAPVLSGTWDAPNTEHDLSWTASVSGSTTIASYVIYRAADGGTYSAIATVDGSTTSYSDSTVDRTAAEHTYKVKAVDQLGFSSDDSNVITLAKQVPLFFIGTKTVGARVGRSADGATWTELDTSGLANDFTPRRFAYDPVNQRVVGIRGLGTGRHVTYVDDGAAPAQYDTALPAPEGDWNDICCTAAGRLIVVGDDAFAYSDDGGETWTKNTDDMPTGVWTACFYDSVTGNVIAGGTSAKFAISTDGGATFSLAQDDATTFTPYQFTDGPVSGRIIGSSVSNSKVYYSDDGGVTWTSLTPSTDNKVGCGRTGEYFFIAGVGGGGSHVRRSTTGISGWSSIGGSWPVSPGGHIAYHATLDVAVMSTSDTTPCSIVYFSGDGSDVASTSYAVSTSGSRPIAVTLSIP